MLLPAPAGAQVVPGDYGGGAIATGTGPRHQGPGTAWLSAVVGAGGSARVAGAASVRCGLARFDAQVALAPDGGFSFTRTACAAGATATCGCARW